MCLWKTPKIPTPSVTARELVPSTESKEPNSPKFGGSDDWKTTSYGSKSLQVNKKFNDTNINNGGWNI